MSELTPDRRAEIRARCERATGGPWRWERPYGLGEGERGSLVTVDGETRSCPYYCRWTDESGAEHRGQGPDIPHEHFWERARILMPCGAHAESEWTQINDADAEFVANARADVPDLLAALDAAEAEVARLRERVSFGNHKRHQCEDNLSAAEARLALTRGELDAAYEMASRLIAEKKALEGAARDAVDCLGRVLHEGRPFSLSQRDEVKLALESLVRSLRGTEVPQS